MLKLLVVIVIGLVLAVGYKTWDAPKLADQIQSNVDQCLDTVGFWPCSARHLSIVRKKVCNKAPLPPCPAGRPCILPKGR
jgi:hypothetical protein